jgi:hypothetical protein
LLLLLKSKVPFSVSHCYCYQRAKCLSVSAIVIVFDE